MRDLDLVPIRHRLRATSPTGPMPYEEWVTRIRDSHLDVPALLDEVVRLRAEIHAYADRVDALRDQVEELTRSRDEWEANEQEQYREVQRLQALLDEAQARPRWKP